MASEDIYHKKDNQKENSALTTEQKFSKLRNIAEYYFATTLESIDPEKVTSDIEYITDFNNWRITANLSSADEEKYRDLLKVLRGLINEVLPGMYRARDLLIEKNPPYSKKFYRLMQNDIVNVWEKIYKIIKHI